MNYPNHKMPISIFLPSISARKYVSDMLAYVGYDQGTKLYGTTEIRAGATYLGTRIVKLRELESLWGASLSVRRDTKGVIANKINES